MIRLYHFILTVKSWQKNYNDSGELMPKNEVDKVNIDSRGFEDVVHACGSSINKLGALKEQICSASTLYRSLRQGKMREQYLEQFARYLNVDICFLKGDYHKRANSYDDEIIRNIAISNLKPENYPYYPSGKVKSDNKEKARDPLIEVLEAVLPMFEIPLNRFDTMEFEERWSLEHDFLCAMIPIIRKHFDVDNRGRADMPDLERVINSHENYRDDFYFEKLVDEKIRKGFMSNPPTGYTAVDIARMSVDALIGLDMEINWGKGD